MNISKLKDFSKKLTSIIELSLLYTFNLKDIFKEIPNKIKLINKIDKYLVEANLNNLPIKGIDETLDKIKNWLIIENGACNKYQRIQDELREPSTSKIISKN